MTLPMVATLLSQRIGIDAGIIGDRKIAKAVEARRTTCDLPDVNAYFKVLQSSPTEFDALVEQLVVPETWFFRDRKPFDFLVDFVRSEWFLKARTSKLRVLSVPCSTGEEPYSIAIALLEAGLPVTRFSIDAIDISQRALTKAQQATYGKNSFRGEDWVERNRYFQTVGDKYELSPAIRDAVQFRQGNILEMFLSGNGEYDVIFCRNLLIYIEQTACEQILTKLHQLLAPEGLLFVGASETGKVSADRFLYLRQSFTFAYRKLSSASASTSTGQPGFNKLFPPRTTSQAFKRSVTSKPLSLRSLSTTPATRSGSVRVAPKLDLQQAQSLADAGYLDAAIQCCKTYLEHHSTNVEAHTLLGTLYQATANYNEAESCFRKALYLNPSHYEALMQLSLLKESLGDAIAAQRLQQRIQKLSLLP